MCLACKLGDVDCALMVAVLCRRLVVPVAMAIAATAATVVVLQRQRDQQRSWHGPGHAWQHWLWDSWHGLVRLFKHP